LCMWATRYLERAHSILELTHGEPVFWADELRACIARVEAAVRDEPGHLTGEHTEIQAMLRRYGELLSSWPAIVLAARRLRTRGLRCAVSL